VLTKKWVLQQPSGNIEETVQAQTRKALILTRR
jgi:hypothetical protein